MSASEHEHELRSFTQANRMLVGAEVELVAWAAERGEAIGTCTCGVMIVAGDWDGVRDAHMSHLLFVDAVRRGYGSGF